MSKMLRAKQVFPWLLLLAVINLHGCGEVMANELMGLGGVLQRQGSTVSEGRVIVLDWEAPKSVAPQVMTVNVFIESRGNEGLFTIPTLNTYVGYLTYGSEEIKSGPIRFGVPGNGVTFSLPASTIRLEIESIPFGTPPPVDIVAKASLAYGQRGGDRIYPLTWADPEVNIAAAGNATFAIPLHAKAFQVMPGAFVHSLDVLMDVPLTGSAGVFSIASDGAAAAGADRQGYKGFQVLPHTCVELGVFNRGAAAIDVSVLWQLGL